MWFTVPSVDYIYIHMDMWPYTDPCNVNKWNEWNEKYCYLERLYKVHTAACSVVSVNSGTFYNISCFWLSNFWGLTFFEFHKKL